MSDNPYSPPTATLIDGGRKSSRLCTVMFWLALVLSLVMLAIAANGGYQYWLYSTLASIKLNPSILAETVCVACGGLAMLYSAFGWRRQLVRSSAIWFVCALLTFLVGPLLV